MSSIKSIILRLFFCLLIGMMFSCKKNPGSKVTRGIPASNNIIYAGSFGSLAASTAYNIYSCNDTGGNKQLFLESKSLFSSPIWSKNNKIYFIGNYNNQGYQFYSANAVDGVVTRITNFPDFNWSKLDISRVTENILYLKPSDVQFDVILCTNNVDGTNEQEIMRLTHSQSAEGVYPGWHPVKDKILFQDVEQINGQQVRNIYQVNADGTGKIKITNNLSPDKRYTNFRFSPDATKIAYTSTNLLFSADDVIVSNIDGSNETRIAVSRNPLQSWSNGEWLADGRRLVLYFSELRQPQRFSIYNTVDVSRQGIADALYPIGVATRPF